MTLKWLLKAYIILYLTAIGFSQGNANLIPNPGFEAGKNNPDSWMVTNGIIAETTAEWGVNQGRSGMHSLKITVNSNPSCSQGWILNDKSLIPVHDSAYLKFSGWMKTEDIVSGRNEYQVPTIRVLGYDENGKFIRNYWLAKNGKAKTDWTKYETTITLGNDIKMLRIFCGMNACTGTAWFDDLELTLTTPRRAFKFVDSNERFQDILENITEPIIIPQPWKEQYGNCSYSIENPIIVQMPVSNDYLTNELKSVFAAIKQTNIPIAQSGQDISSYKTLVFPVIKNLPDENGKFFKNEKINWAEIGEEGYVLSIKAIEGQTIILLAANSSKGIFYAVQTLKQSIIKNGNAHVLREMHIIDKPSFTWRGMVSGSVSMARVDKWMTPLKLNMFYGVYSPCRSTQSRYKWWVPFSKEEKKQISKWVSELEERFIQPVAGTRPDRGYTRRIRFSSAEDVNTVLQTYKDYYECGFRIFKLDYDDGPDFLEYPEDKAKFKDLAEAHYYLANEIYKMLKTLDRKNIFVVGPIHYYNPLEWTQVQKKYIEKLSQLPEEIIFFNADVGKEENADEFMNITKRKPLFWDNWVTHFELMKPLPSIVSAPFPLYSARITDSISGYIAPLLDKPMFWYLTSDYMWNASRYDAKYSNLRSLVKLYGKSNVQNLYAYEKLISEKRNLKLSGNSKEEKLEDAEKLITDFNSAADEIRNMRFPELTKEAEETAADRIAVLQKVLIPEIKSKPCPVSVPDPKKGETWNTADNIPETIWQNDAVLLKGFSRPLGGGYKSVLAEVQTEVRLLHDHKNLYIKLICFEPCMKSLKAKKMEHDSDIYSDDCVEMMLGAANGGNHYIHIAINSLGFYYDANRHDVKWDIESMVIKTGKTDESWSILVTIPLDSIYKTLGKHNQYNINFYRERYAGEKPEYSSWSLVERGFHEPNRFWPIRIE